MVGFLTSILRPSSLIAVAVLFGVPPPVSIADLLNNPVTYLGHEIVVSARVADVYNANVFTLEEPGPFHTGNDVIVVMQEPHAIPMDGSNVTVTGIVQPFVRDELESKFDLSSVNSGVLDAWNHQPVMFARSVRTSHGAELAAPPAPAAPEPSR
jgi:hypothetical protein